MWPRRNQAPAAPPAATAKAAVSTPAASVRAPVAAAPVKKPDDDCGWLMRAVAGKKKKAATPGTGLSKPMAVPVKAKKDEGNPKAIASKVVKKRPLESSKSTTASKAAKLPRGIGWSQPAKWNAAKDTATKKQDQDSAQTQPAGESFDDVFAEVFGASKRPKAAVLGDDEPSLPINTSLFLPEHSADTAQQSAPAQARTSHSAGSSGRAPVKASVGKEDSAWDFKAPNTIALDAFDTSAKNAADETSTRTNDVSSASFSRYKDEQTSHSVSDNFVRLNMRKRFKGSTGKAKKRPAYLRSSGFEDAEEKIKRSDSKANATNGAGSSGGSGAFMDDGIDFIEECLEVLKKYESNTATGENSVIDPAVSATSSMTTDSEPPRCQHALVCTRVLVKKKNKNHGRAFFACPLGYDEGRCDYFLWEENHTSFALQRLFGGPPASTDEDSTEKDVNQPPAIDFAPLDLSKPMEKQAKAMLTNLRLVFGHSDFRDGQQWAIQRVFERKRTLLVLPTGAGKSLCYQYPALFLPGITIVISPLISLMNDQFHNLPPVLKSQATCVTTSGSNSKTQYAEFVRDLLGGKLKLLFVSPEKALTGGFQRLLTQMQSRISLVCVDEAHCISEWSHHFRPSYLRLQSVFALADSVLAITATASRRVERDILSQLDGSSKIGILGEHDQNVLRMPWQRDNLHLRVVRVTSDEERLEKLCEVLLKSTVNGAMIMYVHQQWQAEAMANLLQERLVMDGGNVGPPGTKSKTAWTKHKIAAYHAKMDPETKEKVRLGFLSGRVKLVIATIAFGMGIDKQNVRLVVHYHVPSSIEHYLQQVGRAGRDGRPAQALLFLLDDDVRAFRSLLFSNSLHVSQVQRLVELVAGASQARDPSKEQHIVVMEQSPFCSRVWMEVAWLEQHLDMKSAMIETFLTLMSLTPAIQSEMQLTLRPTSMSWCVISMMESQLRSPQADPVLKRLVASVMGNGVDSSPYGHVEVDVDGYLRHLKVHFHVAALAKLLLPPIPAPEHQSTASGSLTIDIQARRLMQSVRTWQANGLIKKFQMEKTAFDIDLQWLRPAFPATTAEVDLSQHQQCVTPWTKLLYTKHEALEAMELKRLRHLYSALSSAASPWTSPVKLDADSDDEGETTHVLEQKLTSYFEEDHRTADGGEEDAGTQEEDDTTLWRSLTASLSADLVETIERDIEVLTSRPPNASIEEDDAHEPSRTTTPAFGTADAAHSVEWNGYNVARIFHGLASPCFPSKVWRDQLWWRKYAHVAFEQLIVIAEKVLQESLSPLPQEATSEDK